MAFYGKGVNKVLLIVVIVLLKKPQVSVKAEYADEADMGKQTGRSL